MKTENQLTALANMAEHAGSGIVIHLKQCEDKRRTVPKFFANIGNATISPVLDYSNMNCFLMGYAKAKGGAL